MKRALDPIASAAAGAMAALAAAFPTVATVQRVAAAFGTAALPGREAWRAAARRDANWRAVERQAKRLAADNPEVAGHILVTDDNRVSSLYGAALLSAGHEAARAVMDDAGLSSATIASGARGLFTACTSQAEGATHPVAVAIGEGFAMLAAALHLEAAASVAYATAEEVQAARDVAIDHLDALTDMAFSPEALAAYARAHREAMGVLDGLELQLPRIETIAFAEMPPSVLAYQLYGSLGRADTILDLNPRSSAVLFERSARVLRDG